jgi:hypothetical protein
MIKERFELSWPVRMLLMLKSVDGIEFVKAHDATLNHMIYDWERACFTVMLTSTSETVANLEFHEATRVEIPRLLPWGPSRSINEVRQAASNKFEIEVQSGDVITIEASSWGVRRGTTEA